MLTELKVSQFAIIDGIHIQFNNGLNILSGETGAGKSILIKSLALLMGAKSSGQDVRSQKEKALIEGAFDLSLRKDIKSKLEEMGIDTSDNSLIVRRVIQKAGSSKVYLNGQLSTVSDLKKVVFPLVTLTNPNDAPLIEITGQHENKDLMSPRYQLEVLDQFCGNQKLRESASDFFDQLRILENKMEDLDRLSMQREQRIDFLKYQIKEIDELSLEPKEDELLSEKIRNLKEQGKWSAWLNEAEYQLNSSDDSILSRLKNILKQAPGGPAIEKVTRQLEQAYSLIDDSSFELHKISNPESGDDESLDHLEDRLSRIRKLQKKFGKDVDTILESYKKMSIELTELLNIGKTRKALTVQQNKLNAELGKVCKKLHKKRSEASNLLAKEVNQELKDLNMKGLEFLIKVESLAAPQATGQDRVIFQTKTGKNDEARLLSKAASGGELSRILLSLKQVIGASQNPRTYLFDEVDTGVSGPTAEKVGAKLKNLSKHQQVICVTHLPQVASFGDHHFFIEKHPEKKGVHMSVQLLDTKSRVNEIARLISGEKLSKTSLAHAKQLLSDAR